MLGRLGKSVLSHPLSRRRLLGCGATGLISALALSGCGGDGQEQEEDGNTAPAEPQYGGTPAYGLVADPGGLDVQQSVTGFWCSAMLNGYLHSVELEDQSLYPQMASGIEQPDDTTYIWKLRPGIRFHDMEPVNGREVTADDVLYSMTRRRDDPTILNDKQLLRDFTASMEATDPLTFRLVTTRPYSPVLDEIGNPSYAIIPQEAIEKWGDLSQHPIGCGAFMLGEYVKAERLELVRNPQFYMEGLPYLDGMKWTIILDNSTLFQAFRTGQHDYCGASLNKFMADELEQLGGVIVTKSANYWTRSLLLRVDRSPFDDPRVCQAVDLAVDRQDMLAKLSLGEGLVSGPISPYLAYWCLPQDEVRDFYKVDLAEANSLMSAAGYESGLDVEAVVMNVQNLTQDASIVKEHLARIGIRLNIQAKEIPVILAQHLYPGNFQMLWYYNLPYVEPDRPLCNWFSKGIAGVSFTGYDSPEMDEWIWRERSEFDPEKRREIVLEAQRAMMREHGPQINTFSPQTWSAAWDRLHYLHPGRGVALSSRGFLGTEVWMES